MRRVARAIGFFVGYFMAAAALLMTGLVLCAALGVFFAEAVNAFGPGRVLLTAALVCALGLAAHGVWLERDEL